MGGAVSPGQGIQAGWFSSPSISVLIFLMAKRKVIWLIYNLVPPCLCWKPLMTRCLLSAGLRVFCQNTMMDYAHGDLLWLFFCKPKRVEWKGDREAGEYPYLPHFHPGSRMKVLKGRAEQDSPFCCLPLTRDPSSREALAHAGNESPTGLFSILRANKKRNYLGKGKSLFSRVAT